MSGLLYLLLSLVICSHKCTYTSNMISITDDSSLEDIKDEYRPIFLRLTSPGCPYSPASNDQWTKASELYPQVDFVTVDCWKNSKICSLFGSSLMTPYHALVPANSTKPIEETRFGNNKEIQQTPQKFLDIVQTYTGLYPVSPPLVNLFPLITDSFYSNIDDPIFLLYDSLCSDQIPFLNAWAKVANEVIIPDSDNPRIGMLDCSTHFDECQRWIRPYAPKTPIALIYSSKTGNFEVLENYKNIDSDLIDGLYTNALSKPNRPMPTPVALPDKATVKPSTEGYTILENSNLQERSIETVKGQYKESFVYPSSACNTPSDCDKQTLNTPGQCPDILPSADDHSKAIGIINFLRNLAGLKVNVSEDSDWNNKCYTTAFNIHKIGRVPSDHNVKPDYAKPALCGTPESVQVAKDSLLAQNDKSTFVSAFKFVIDEGANNDLIVGHRRWLLHPNLNKIGLGYYPYKEDYYQVAVPYYMMLPAVTVLKVVDQNVPGYTKESIPADLSFISWPPAGPFPIDQLPSNWHISHTDLRSVELKDLKIHIERDDGAELTISRSNLPRDINGDTLVMQISPEGLKLCQPMRKITVSVFNNKVKKVYRFTFELFNTNGLTEVCLYNTDVSKCPSSVPSENRFGPGNYQSPVFSSVSNQVKVHVVEPITLSSPLKFTASARFFLTGSTVNGQIQIGRNSVVDIQDPTLTDFSIDWSVKNRKIGKLETAKKAKTVSVSVLDNSESVSVHDLTFYTGIQTTCRLSSFLYHGQSKDVYFNLGGSDGNYYVSVSPIDVFQAYSTSFNNDINNRPNVIVLDSIFDLSKQKTNKRVIKVYLSSIDKLDPINLSCFLTGRKRDYQFMMFGGEAYFRCDMEIAKVASSITFLKNDLFDSGTYKFQAYPPTVVDSTDRREICPMDFITINDATFSSTAYSIPYVKGDINAKNSYDPVNFFSLYPDEDYTGGSTIAAYTDYSYGRKSKCIVTLPDNDQTSFTINLKMDSSKHNPMIIRPSPGTESKQVTLSIYDLDLERKMPDSPSSLYVFFENFQDLILDTPTYNTYLKKSVLPAYHFDNCGKVQFKTDSSIKEPVNVGHDITLSGIDYGIPIQTTTVTVSDSSSYDASNIQTKSLTVESKTTSTVKNIEVEESINVNSASITLNQCTLKEDITLNLKRTEQRWPSISLVDTEIKPSSITIDLGITDSLKLMESDEEYENHILINGISNQCDQIKNTATITNKGKYSIECASENTQLVAVKGKDNAPVLPPEGSITQIPTSPVDPVEPVITDAPTTPENPEPPVVTEKPEPPVVTEKPEPPVVTEKPEPPVVTEKPEPPVVTEKPEPPVVTEKPEPPVVTEKPEPPVVTEKPEPPVVTEKPEPPVVTEKPEPPVVTEKPEPPVVTEKPEPPVVTDKPEPPVVTESVPTKKPVDPVVTEDPSTNQADDGSNNNGSGNNKKLPIGAIIGVVGGVVVVIVIIIVVLYIIKKRKTAYVRSSDGEDEIKGIEGKMEEEI